MSYNAQTTPKPIRMDLARKRIQIRTHQGPYKDHWAIMERFEDPEQMEKRFKKLLSNNNYKEV